MAFERSWHLKLPGEGRANCTPWKSAISVQRGRKRYLSSGFATENAISVAFLYSLSVLWPSRKYFEFLSFHPMEFY